MYHLFLQVRHNTKLQQNEMTASVISQLPEDTTRCVEIGDHVYISEVLFSCDSKQHLEELGKQYGKLVVMPTLPHQQPDFDPGF